MCKECEQDRWKVNEIVRSVSSTHYLVTTRLEWVGGVAKHRGWRLKLKCQTAHARSREWSGEGKEGTTHE